MDNAVLEYLEGYFGGQLNESTSDEDIMEALNDLLETADAVEEYLDEAGLLKKLTRPLRKRAAKKRAAEKGPEASDTLGRRMRRLRNQAVSDWSAKKGRKRAEKENRKAAKAVARDNNRW